MNETSLTENNGGFSKKLKKGFQNTLTFFGVPANTILVFFGVFLLLLNPLRLIKLLVRVILPLIILKKYLIGITELLLGISGFHLRTLYRYLF